MRQGQQSRVHPQHMETPTRDPAPIFPPALGYRKYVESDVDLARQTLELARATSTRLWDEYNALTKTLDPGRGIAGPENFVT